MQTEVAFMVLKNRTWWKENRWTIPKQRETEAVPFVKAFEIYLLLRVTKRAQYRAQAPWGFIRSSLSQAATSLSWFLYVWFYLHKYTVFIKECNSILRDFGSRKLEFWKWRKLRFFLVPWLLILKKNPKYDFIKILDYFLNFEKFTKITILSLLAFVTDFTEMLKFF